MIKKIKNYMETWQMLKRGDGAVIALSGGADSVCLLLVLQELAASGGWELRALHVHHGLRGAEADRDERFVRELCGNQKIPLVVRHFDVAAYAAQEHLSVEEAGRILRYEALEQEAADWEQRLMTGGRVRIAIAHHMDDQAETVLHHMMRGSGLRGLSGIRPVQGDRIRPLLCVGREEIRRYLKNKGQDWVEDSTNRHEDYTRNRIRRHLIPMLTEEVNAQAVKNLVREAELFAQADAYLMAQAERVMEEAHAKVREGESAAIALERFLQEPQILRSCIVRRMLDFTARRQKDLTAEHFRQIEALAEKQTGAHCDLPGGLAAERTYQELRVFRKTDVLQPESEEIQAIVQRVFPYDPEMEFPKNQYTKWFDYDKIKDMLFVRTRRSGDFITLAGGGRKSIKRYMIDEKIPREERDKILLLAEHDHVLWIIGYRISEYYKITSQTRQVLEVSMNGGKDYDRESACIINRGRGQ